MALTADDRSCLVEVTLGHAEDALMVLAAV